MIQDLAQTMLVFHDKILNDLYETVKVYRRAQVALDGARGESDLIALQVRKKGKKKRKEKCLVADAFSCFRQIAAKQRRQST